MESKRGVKAKRQRRRVVLISLSVCAVGIIGIAHKAGAGANANGTVRLSWERNRNVGAVEQISGDTLILYCRIENLLEPRAIGVVLNWEPRARPGCYEQINPPTSVGCGRVLIDRAPQGQRTLGGREFSHAITFPPGVARNVVAFAFLVRNCDPPVPTSFVITHAAARDDAGAIDNLAVVGGAEVLGGSAEPTYSPPENLRTQAHMGALSRRFKVDGRVRLLHSPTAPLGGELIQRAMAAVATHSEELGIRDIGQLVPVASIDEPHSAHVLISQKVAGVPVLSGGVAVHFDGSGRPMRIGNRFIPNLNGSATPTVSLDEAVDVAREEIGSPEEEGRGRLVIYPLAMGGELAWEIGLREWVVYVSALSRRVLGVREAVLRSEPARIWAPHPWAMSGNTSLRSDSYCSCQFENYYETVGLEDLVYDQGVPVLETARTRLVAFGIPNPPVPRGQFIFSRCAPLQPNGTCQFDNDHGFLQVMGFYFVDRMQKYIIEDLDLSYNVAGQALDPVGFTALCNGGRYDWISDVLCFGQGDNVGNTEDPEVVIHEYGHSLLEDACFAHWNDLDPEAPAINEGFGDALGVIALAHEPDDYDTPWGEWTNQDPGPNPDPWYGRAVVNNKRYPHDWSFNPHSGGRIWSGTLWSIFEAYEEVYGPCTEGSGSSTFLGPCLARDRFITAVLTAHRISCGSSTSLRGISESLLAYEMGLQNPNGTLVNLLVDAIDRRGHFFSEQSEPFGATFTPLITGVDQQQPASQVIRIRIENATWPIQQVKLYHSNDQGPFTNPPIDMTVVSPFTYEGTIPAPTQPALMRYFVEAVNALGVKSHWPEASPDEDVAAFLTGIPGARAVYACNQCNLPQTIGSGTTREFNISVQGGSVITDVNCHVILDCAAPEMITVRLTHIGTDTRTTALFDPMVPAGGFNFISSLPSHFDWWFDDEQDAYYNHFRPWRFSATGDQMAVFDNRAQSGTWRLTVENAAGGAPAQLRAFDVQIRIPTQTSVSSSDAPVRVTRLGLCKPNPFRLSTSIPYAIAEDGRTDIRIYDGLGRVVRVLEGRNLQAGEYSISWDGRADDGRRVASGVYFYELRAGSRSYERKLVVVR